MKEIIFKAPKWVLRSAVGQSGGEENSVLVTENDGSESEEAGSRNAGLRQAENWRWLERGEEVEKGGIR